MEKQQIDTLFTSCFWMTKRIEEVKEERVEQSDGCGYREKNSFQTQDVCLYLYQLKQKVDLVGEEVYSLPLTLYWSSTRSKTLA